MAKKLVVPQRHLCYLAILRIFEVKEWKFNDIFYPLFILIKSGINIHPDGKRNIPIYS